MWIVLWIVSAARDGDARGARQMANPDLAEVWARSLDGLADLQIQPHQRAWLKLTRPLGLVENTALIATPNEFVKEQLETRLRALITQALSQQLGRDIQLAVTVDPSPQAPVTPQGPVAPPGPMSQQSPGPTAAPAAGLPRPDGGADLGQEPPAPRLPGLPGPQVTEEGPGSRLGHPATAPHPHPARDSAGEPAAADQGRPVVPGAPGAIPAAARLGGTRLNSKYTFETFVIGSSNRFAHAAA